MFQNGIFEKTISAKSPQYNYAITSYIICTAQCRVPLGGRPQEDMDKCYKCINCSSSRQSQAVLFSKCLRKPTNKIRYIFFFFYFITIVLGVLLNLQQHKIT